MAGKIITKQKRIGQLGVNLIERIVLRMGFKPQQMNAELDTGIDGLIEICDPESGQATNSIIFFQSRAKKQFDRETENSFEYTCDADELAYWLSGNVPVLLIVSRSDSDNEAYWVEVKSYFCDKKKLADRRVIFDKQRDLFNIAAADALRRLSVPHDSGIYLDPPPAPESLISNLFRITRYPMRLFTASTNERRGGDVWGRAQELGIRLPGCEWFLKSGQCVSAHNLSQLPWTHFVNADRCESFDATEWSLSDDVEQTRDFARLLRLCLQQRLKRWSMSYSRDLDLFYFSATPNKKASTVLLPGSKQPKTVFAPYESKFIEGRVSYFRHQAFYAEFHRIDDDWYVSVTPTYHFTSDGRTQSRFAGELTQGIKRLERQGAVLGNLRLWQHVLTRDRPLCEAIWSQDQPEYTFLTFDRATEFAFKLSIDDIAWLKREERERAAIITGNEEASLFDQGPWQ